jgi:hypothetical protein
VTAVNNEGLKIAEVKITRTLCGQRDLTGLFYIASKMFPDDISDAQLGETTLLFLRKLRKPPSEYDTAIQKVTRGAPLFYVAHSGRGRLVPIRIEGDDYIYFRLGRRILLPPTLSALWKPDPKDRSLGLIRLSDLVDFIEHYDQSKAARTPRRTGGGHYAQR